MAPCGPPWVIGRGVEAGVPILIRVNKKKINRVMLIKTGTTMKMAED